MPQSLAESLKTETRALHIELERGALMGELIRGEMRAAPYCRLLRQLHFLYDTLEPALQAHAQHPAVAPVYFPALFRCRAVADDLEALHGADWHDAIDVLPSARHYARHLQAIADGRPALLVAHAYVRYLGDLSGGQMLRRIVANALGRADGRGTAFYDFGSPADVATQVRAYRAGLAQVTTDAAEVAAIVAEAVHAFELHRTLFNDLAVVGDLAAVAAAPDVESGSALGPARDSPRPPDATLAAGINLGS